MARTPAKATDSSPNLFEDLLESQDFISGNEALDEGTFIDDKDNLVGVPFFVTGWTHREGSGGLINVHVEAVVSSGERIGFADFSTGVRAQLEDITRKMRSMGTDEEIAPLPMAMTPPKPMYFPHGLRVSVYGYRDELAGTTTQAKTYYLDSAK